MARLRELPAIGLGLQPPAAEARRASSALTRRERRKVHANIRAGLPAWDEPSARYALEVARAQAMVAKSFGRFTAVAGWVLVVFAWLNVFLQSFGSGPIEFAEMVLRILAAVAFTVFVIRYPAWSRNAGRAQALNAPLVADSPVVHPTGTPTNPGEKAVGAVLAALLFGVPFGVSMGLSDSSVLGGLLGGACFGVFMVFALRWIFRRAQQS